MGLLEILEEKWGLVTIYHQVVDKIFNWTLRRDIKEQKSYQGYPTKFVKFLDEKGKKWGIKIVDHSKSDYTFYPLMYHFRDFLGGTDSWLFKKLEKFNMKYHGGFFKRDRHKIQLDTLETYVEYLTTMSHPEIVQSLVNRNSPHYIRKILREHLDKSDIEGGGMLDFIKDNQDYFSEIRTIFEVEDRPTAQLLEVALEELEKLSESSSRGFLMKYSMFNGVLNIIIAIVAFSRLVLPEALSSFDGNVSMMSAPIRWMDKVGYFLVDQWYLALLVVFILYLVTRTTIFKMTMGYLSFKVPVAKEYVVNDQLLKFFQTYQIVSETQSTRNAFQYGYYRIDNDYLKFVFGRYVDGGPLDLAERSVNLSTILSEIPYIPREYIDIIRDTELTGNSQEAIPKIILLIEPRLKKVNDQLQKIIIFGSMGISMAVTITLSAFLMKDITNMVNISEERFYDSIR